MSDIMNSSILQKMKVADLKKLLKEKRLSTVGNKAELIARLETGEGSGDAEHLNASHEDEEDLLEDEDDELCAAVDPSELSAVELDASLPISPVVPTKSVTPVKATTSATVSTTAAAVQKPKITKIEVGPPTMAKPAAADKLQDRLKRFGVVSEDVKKQVRADRFLISSTDKVKTGPATAIEDSAILPTKKTITPVVLSSTTVVEDQARLKKRSERFGTSVTSVTPGLVTASTKSVVTPPVAKTADIDTLKKRAERFGQLTSTSLTKVVEQERVLKRKGRFGTILAPANASSDGSGDAKRMKRAERFGLPAAAVAVAAVPSVV